MSERGGGPSSSSLPCDDDDHMIIWWIHTKTPRRAVLLTHAHTQDTLSPLQINWFVFVAPSFDAGRARLFFPRMLLLRGTTTWVIEPLEESRGGRRCFFCKYYQYLAEFRIAVRMYDLIGHRDGGVWRERKAPERYQVQTLVVFCFLSRTAAVSLHHHTAVCK